MRTSLVLLSFAAIGLAACAVPSEAESPPQYSAIMVKHDTIGLGGFNITVLEDTKHGNICYHSARLDYNQTAASISCVPKRL